MKYHPANFVNTSYDYSLSIYGPLGQHGSHKSRDLVTWSEVDLGGHGGCGWCGSSSSIRVPRLKFVSLGVQKIWRTMCVNINRPGDPDLWPFDLESGMRFAFKAGNLPSKFGHARPFDSGIICYVRYRRTDKTDERTKATLIAPFRTGGGIMKDSASGITLLNWQTQSITQPLCNSRAACCQ